MNQVPKDNQIKGECQLRNLVKSIGFCNEKFDELERYKSKKEVKINELEEKTRKMDKKINDLNRVIDRHERHSRRNCILVQGVKANKNEDTNVVETETLNEPLQEKLTQMLIQMEVIGQVDLKRANNQGLSSSSLPDITLEIVFKNKKKLKDTVIGITESLTQKRIQMLSKARNEFLFKNLWTQDRKILVKSDDNTIKVYNN